MLLTNSSDVTHHTAADLIAMPLFTPCVYIVALSTASVGKDIPPVLPYQSFHLNPCSWTRSAKSQSICSSPLRLLSSNQWMDVAKFCHLAALQVWELPGARGTSKRRSYISLRKLSMAGTALVSLGLAS